MFNVVRMHQLLEHQPPVGKPRLCRRRADLARSQGDAMTSIPTRSK